MDKVQKLSEKIYKNIKKKFKKYNIDGYVMPKNDAYFTNIQK